MSAHAQLDVVSARRQTLKIAGVDGRSGGGVAVLQTGRPDGPPVLLVPGYTGGKEDFGPLLAPLAAAGYAVTAMDLPGQFESPGPTEPGDYSCENLGAVVRAVAARLAPRRGRRVHLVGHSFGGLVARAAVIAAPATFESLVLLCSGPADIRGARRAAMTTFEPVLAERGLVGVYAAMRAAAAAVPGYTAPSAELAAFLERRFLGGSPQMLQGMAAALRTEPDRVAELADVGVPVLVAHGADDDAWTPSVQHDMARRLGAGYVVIAQAAHSPAVENPPATVAALLEFWRRA